MLHLNTSGVIDYMIKKYLKKCDLSRENVPYDIHSNGWTHGKRTDKKRLDKKPFETDRWTAERMEIFFERLSQTAERM